MSSRFQLGFKSIKEELQLDRLNVSGKIPEWLSGSLIINGPGMFEIGNNLCSHWFDGLAMLRRFNFENGNVSFRNKFIQSRGYKKGMETGEISYEQFATYTRSPFYKRWAGLFTPMKFANNTNTNIVEVDKHFLAITESPSAIEFDPKSLETKGTFDYQDRIRSVITTAHPQYDPNKKVMFNYAVDFSLVSKYKLFYKAAGSKSRQLITTIPVKKPAYMHSFGMTENYLILTEFPLLVSPLRFLWGGKPFIENYRWIPDRGTRFLLVRKSDGEITRIYESEPFFAFHHINAFEQDDQIVLDIAAYPDAAIIKELYLDRLRRSSNDPFPPIEIRRYRLSMHSESITYEVISDESIELPRINDSQYTARSYQYAYGVGHNKLHAYDFANQLTKIDFQGRSAKIWFKEGCYPGEPIFIPAPDPHKEDDGIILSLVLNVNETNSSLHILDAQSFSEIACVEVSYPIPLGFHGQFFWNV